MASPSARPGLEVHRFHIAHSVILTSRRFLEVRRRALWAKLERYGPAKSDRCATRKRRLFGDMAKKRPGNTRQTSLNDSAISLFDRENLEFLDALRYRPPSTPAMPAAPAERAARPMATELGKAEQIFAECRIADTDETWAMGELNVKIIHRGRIRIRRKEWQQVIDTCSTGFSEDGIRKDFHLNILQHPAFVRLVYISYRYKQAGDKQQEHRRGILLDEQTNIQNMMTRLAFWFTAQPHAEANYAVFERLVDEAMAKLTRVAACEQ